MLFGGVYAGLELPLSAQDQVGTVGRAEHRHDARRRQEGLVGRALH
jgi:hypothetical protein